MQIREVSSERIRELRGKRSREVIAHALRRRGHGTDAKTIWRWEKGAQPQGRVLADLADVLGAESIEELYDDAPFQDGEAA